MTGAMVKLPESQTTQGDEVTVEIMGTFQATQVSQLIPCCGLLEKVSSAFIKLMEVKRKFSKYLKESCCLASAQHFSFKWFQQYAFISKIFPKSLGLGSISTTLSDRQSRKIYVQHERTHFSKHYRARQNRIEKIDIEKN